MSRTIATVAVIALAVAVPTANELGAHIVDRANLPGDCRAFVNESDPSQYGIACVPAIGWNGGTVDTVWEDGSALYSDGSVFDPEDMRYRWSS